MNGQRRELRNRCVRLRVLSPLSDNFIDREVRRVNDATDVRSDLISLFCVVLVAPDAIKSDENLIDLWLKSSGVLLFLQFPSVLCNENRSQSFLFRFVSRLLFRIFAITRFRSRNPGRLRFRQPSQWRIFCAT